MSGARRTEASHPASDSREADLATSDYNPDMEAAEAAYKEALFGHMIERPRATVSRSG
jgi:hypothetical protein